MRIVLISEYNSLVSIGGTEYYLDILVRELCANGHEVLIISQGQQKDTITKKEVHAGDGVYFVSLLPYKDFSKSEITLKIVSTTWPLILYQLRDFSPEVVHVHTYTTFFNIRHFELCFANGFNNVVFTSHIAGHFCPKGDLIRNNKSCCDGLLSSQCYVCMFSKSIKSGVSNLLNSYQKRMLNDLRALSNIGVKIICTAQWQKEQLIRNGFYPSYIKVIRQVLETVNYRKINQNKSDKFTIGFLGRLTEEKGSRLLLNVIREFKHSSNIQFLLGVPIGNSDITAINELKNYTSSNESKVTINPSVNSENKYDFFNSIDCLFIPSYCIETGPIVLLEALLYTRFVIAPDIGGPLEFQQRFGNAVQLYKWNDIRSVKQIVERLQLGEIVKDDRNYQNVFEKDRQTFTEDHISLYKADFHKM